MQSRGGPERERERARTWRWRQLSRGGREGCGDAESGRECGRQGPESLRPAWGTLLGGWGKSALCLFPGQVPQEPRAGQRPPGLQPAGGARWRRRPSRRVGLTRKAVAGLARPAEPPPRQEKCAHRGRLQTITRGPERHPPLSLPGCPGAVLRSRAGRGGGVRVPACSACIHARRPRVWVSRKKPHLLPLPAQAVCGTVVWGRPAPAPLWGVVWLCVGEPYFTERRPTADACAPRSGFGWCLRRPAGHSPERQWPDHRACLLLIQRVWPAAREKPPCSRVSDAPMRRCDRRCETLRSRRSDRCLICILIAREVGPLFMCSQSRQ